MLEGQMIALSVRDFFTKPMLKIAFLPLIITMIVLLIAFYSAADYGFDSLQIYIETTQNGQDIAVDPNAPFYYIWATAVIAFLFQYSVTSWLVGFLFYTIGTLFVMMFSVFTTLIIIGFLTPFILENLQKKHYKEIKTNGFGNILSPLWVLFRSGLIMVIMFFVLMPLYFIPFINIIAFNLPLYYFFHKLLNYDIASTILTKEEYAVIHAKKANSFRARTVFLYILSMVPFITLFTAVFYIIYLGHGYFQELKKIRNNEDSILNNLETKQIQD
ncbi:MAG: EI24 domain-containing protein [Campylobacteraceae bacterium]|nr:EI24 domain-containing protein [Campylobacteraceae bacterium]